MRILAPGRRSVEYILPPSVNPVSLPLHSLQPPRYIFSQVMGTTCSRDAGSQEGTSPRRRKSRRRVGSANTTTTPRRALPADETAAPTVTGAPPAVSTGGYVLPWATDGNPFAAPPAAPDTDGADANATPVFGASRSFDRMPSASLGESQLVSSASLDRRHRSSLAASYGQSPRTGSIGSVRSTSSSSRVVPGGATSVRVTASGRPYHTATSFFGPGANGA